MPLLAIYSYGGLFASIQHN